MSSDALAVVRHGSYCFISADSVTCALSVVAVSAVCVTGLHVVTFLCVNKLPYLRP